MIKNWYLHSQSHNFHMRVIYELYNEKWLKSAIFSNIGLVSSKLKQMCCKLAEVEFFWYSWEGVKGGVNSPFTKKGNALSPIIKIAFPHSPTMYFPNNANHHSLKINFPIHHSPLIFSFSRFTRCALSPFHQLLKFIFTFHQL